MYTASWGGEVELLFIKFERRSVDEWFEFVQAEGLLGYNGMCLTCLQPRIDWSKPREAHGCGGWTSVADNRNRNVAP